VNPVIESLNRASTPASEQLPPNFVPLSIHPSPAWAPDGWEWVSLRKLARLESGHTPSRARPEWWGGDIPWIALPDIRALDGKLAYDTLEHTNDMGIANSSARVLPEGTVVLSRTASVGFVTIMGRPMATSQDFVNWVCGPELDPHFLALLFRGSREYIRSLASGAVHKTVYMPTVKAFHVCVPDFAEQQRIVATLRQQLAAAERARTGLKEQLDAVNALPAALLRRAFSGEL
jgi:type I restriction enzyme S subunit